ncbi:MAG: hypothetical protein KatS3mg097_427 [Candidatus Parcubacteria bacterium]|nr:MAG: hypothetical protein KatS3mg097_427 [Candidatus Parcubacteria bacterium]
MRSFFEKKLALLRSAALLSIFVFSIIGISYAWQNPTVSPPGGNVDAPVNTGTSTQYKAGALGIGGVFNAYNDAYFGITTGSDTTTAPNVSITGNTVGSGYEYNRDKNFVHLQTGSMQIDSQCSCDISTTVADCPDSVFYSPANLGDICFDYYKTTTISGGASVIQYGRFKYDRSANKGLLGGALQVYNKVLIGSSKNPSSHVPGIEFIKTFQNTPGESNRSLGYFISLIKEGLGFFTNNNTTTPSVFFSQDGTLSINTTTDKSMLTIWGNDRNNLLSIFATPSYPFVFVENRNGDGVMTIGNTKYINYIPLSSGLNVIGDNIILSNYKYPSGGVGVISKNVFAHATRDYFSDVSQYNNIKNRTGVGFRCDSNDDINIDQKNYYNGRDADPNYSVGSVCYDLFTEQVSGATLYGFNEFKVITTQVPSGPVVWQYEGLPSINFIDWRKSLSSFSLFNIGGIFRIQGGTSTILSIDAENKNVGINTISIPTTAALYVVGNIKATGDVCDGNRCLKDITGGGGPSYWHLNGTNLYPTDINYKVGIGTTSPNAMLSIKGTSTNNLFSIYTSSSNPALFVDSSGKIGIGTTTPNYVVDIIGLNSVGSLRLRHTSTNRHLLLGGDWPYIESENAGIFINWHNNQPIYIRRNTLFVETNKVGIGTTSPTSMLTIRGTSTNNLFSIYTSSSNPALFVDSSGKSFFKILPSIFNGDDASVVISNKATIFITNTSSNGLILQNTSTSFYLLTRSGMWTNANSSDPDTCSGNDRENIFKECSQVINSCVDVAKFVNIDESGATTEEYLKSTVTCRLVNDPNSRYQFSVNKDSLVISYASSSNNNLLYIFNNGSVSLGDKIYTDSIHSLYYRGSSTRSFEADTLIARKSIFALNGYVVAKKLCFGLGNCLSDWPSGGSASYWNGRNDPDYIYPIATSYKVGIGTTSPDAMLTIRGNTSSSHLLRVYSVTSTIPALFINNNSNVGIGTTSPSAKLHVVGGDAVFSHRIGISTTSPNAMLTIRGTSTNNLFSVYASNSDQVLTINYRGDINIGGGKFFINYLGNVGIGTIIPGVALDVLGDIKSSATITAAVVSSSKICLAGTCRTTWPSGSVGNISGSGNSGYIAKFNDTNSITNSVIYEQSSNIGIGTTNPLAKLHVDGGGGKVVFTNSNVGIGTTNPLVKLEVSGDAKFIGNVSVSGYVEADMIKQKFCLNSSCTSFRQSTAIRGIYDVSGSGGSGTVLYCRPNDKVISAFMAGYGGNDNFGWEIVINDLQEGVKFYPEVNATNLRVRCLKLQ